ncbi:polymorphic toxin-type HINT domain-containing protein [Streptomyces populi]
MSLLTRHLAVVVSSALFAGVLGGQVAQAPTADAAPKHKAAVSVPAQRAGAVPRDQADPAPVKAARSVWPKRAHRTIDLKGLTAGKTRAVTPSEKDAKSVVSVGPAPLSAQVQSRALTSAPAKVDVKVLDKDGLAPVGGTGIGVQLTRNDGRGTPGPIKVTLDYSGFKHAYGGSFASRLRLVALPACAVTTPKKKECSAAKPTSVPISNDVKTGTITATVQADGDPEAGVSVLDKTSSIPGAATLMSASATSSGTVYALAATGSSDAGDYRASTLAPTGSWNVSTGSGAFTYSLPFTAPKPPTGSAPSLGLSYNSQAVDGMTSAVNTQASSSGLGWDLSGIGFIERKYRSCQSDGTGTGWVGDLCWDSPNYDAEHDGAVYVINLNGVTSNLVQDSNGSGWYHVQDDPGWRVQHLTGGHGADDEYWVVSAQDGTRYYFGWGRSERTDPDANWDKYTHSVLTVPVFGNDQGEPGYNGGVGVSTQAYRWGLDRVVDANEVESSYFYEKEQNHYRSVLLGDQARVYDSAAYPVRIEYGWASQIPGAQLPAKVDLNYVGRCVERMSEMDPLTNDKPTTDCPGTGHPDSYPDVPTDLICDGTAADNGCKTITGETYSPTFFATQMLWDVKTFVRDNDNSAWDPAMQYQMKYGMPNPGGTIDANLWLDYVQRKGYGDGDDFILPTININGEYRDNQLGGGVLNFRRVTQIHGDLGSFVNVTYRDYASQDACDISNPPSSESNNTQACFRQEWTPEGSTTKSSGWFKKYVVAQVSVDPGPGSGAGNDGDPVMTTTYDYIGKPAWAFPNDPLTKDADESWTEWRGYQQVEVHTGTKSNAASTYYWLYRGLDGDRTDKNDASKTRSVTVDDGDSTTAAVTDSAWLQGKVLESSTRDGDGQSHKRVWHEYWDYDTAHYEGLPDARFVRESKTTTDELTSTGSWRRHVVQDEYDNTQPASTKYGLPMRTNDDGLDTTTGDERCTTYGRAYNTTDLYPGTDIQRWMVLPDQTAHYAGSCAAIPANQDSYTETLYDGATSEATNKPVDGNATTVHEQVDGTAGNFRETTAAFDQAGRQISTTNGRQKTTTTTYQPTTSWPVNGVKVTTPDPDDNGPGNNGPAAPQSTTTWYSRLWGLPYKTEDVNGQTTRIVLDSVGRISQVFKPSQISAYPDGIPSIAYKYDIAVEKNSEGVPSLVTSTPPKTTTTTLQSSGKLLTRYTYVDGLGRTRETQAPTASGTGRSVVSTRYDTSGNVTGSSSVFYNSGNPATDGMVLPTVASLQSYTDLVIDYAGRTTESRIMAMGQPQTQGQTITNYRGDYTTTMPAVGERTNTYTDVFGQVSKVVEFGPSTYTTSYDYDGSGRLKQITDSKGNASTFTFNWLGERTGGKDPDADPTGSGVTTYDANGNIQSVKDANGTLLTYTYDNLDRPLTVQNGSTVLTRNTYDTASGGIGQLATATSYVGGYAYTDKVNSYDVDGNVTEAQTTIPADGTGFQNTYKTKTTYNAAGQPTSITYPAIGDLPDETVTATYDDIGNPEKLTSSLGNTVYVDSTDFDDRGRLIGRTYGTTATTGTTARRSYSYDDTNGTGWLKNITTTTSTNTNPVQNDDYLRDNAGQTTDLTDRLTGQHQCYTFDELVRISRAWTTAATTGCSGPFTPDLATGQNAYQLDYTYDGIGNLQKVTNTTATTAEVNDYVYPGYSADQSTYTAGAAQPHAVTSIKTPAGTDLYTYYGDGRMKNRTVGTKTTNFTWNELHQVTATSGASTTSYVYDASGDLLERKSTDETVLYLSGQEVHKAPGVAPKATRYYSDGTSTVAMRTAATATTSKLSWIMSDSQSSTQLTIDSATGTAQRRRYLPFGAQNGTTSLPASTDRGFLGKTEDDATGLSVLGARMYDSKLGRFLSPDPLTTPYNPQNLNAYSYSVNNPIAYSDPDGLKPVTGCDRGCSDGDDTYRDGMTQNSDGTWGYHWENTHYVYNGQGQVQSVVKTGSDLPVLGKKIVYVPLDISAQIAVIKFGASLVLPDVGAWKDCLSGSGASSCLIAGTDLPMGKVLKLVPDSLLKKGGKAVEEWITKFAKGGCKCFLAGTGVLMADGKTKEIEDIKLGDKVLATDPETGKTSPRQVTRRIVTDDDKHFNELSIATENGIEKLTATHEHPFWSPSQHDWVQAGNLKPGMTLRTDKGDTVIITGNRSFTQRARTYNLTIDGLHTYYVLAGRTPVLVHNSGGCLPALRNWSSQRFQFGNQSFLLDKNRMEHILTRHHPNYWDGSVKKKQSFFDSSMSVDDVQDAIGQVMRQNRDTLVRRGSQGMYQIRGNVNGVDYVLGMNRGRVGQFYPESP